jgi:hypothetical protein
MREETSRQHTAFLFDLDGTLVDSVYQHVMHGERRLMRKGSSCLSGACIAASG